MKTREAHLDRGAVYFSVLVDVQRHSNEPAFRLNAERPPAGPAGVIQITAEDAQPITGFFRFASVRVENAQTEISLLGGRQRKNAVTADAAVPVADGADVARREWNVQVRRIHREVVVAESVTAKERILHRWALH